MLSTALTALLAFVAPASLDTVEPRLMRNPDIKGDTVVFSYAGDIWVAKTDAGAIARRLTSFPGIEGRPRISPDGRMVAFTGGYDGSLNVYVMPIEGGEPKRLTYSTEGDLVLGWTPNGQVMYFSASGNVVPDQAALYLVDPRGGAPVSTPIKECTSASMFADGNRVAYTRVNSYNFNWRRYRGGTQGRVSIFNMADGSYSELPAGREQSFHPMVVGEDIYYVSDRGTGTLNLFRHRGNQETKLTDFTAADIRFPASDGQSVVFENDGYLHKFDIASGTTTKLAPRIYAENLNARTTLRNLSTFISGGSLSPSGTRLVIEARGELFSVPAKKGETRNLTLTSGTRERNPQWSPDGKSIAFMSDQSGENEVYLRPQMGGEATALTTASGLKMQGLTWFPDSKSLLLTTQDNDLYVLDVATKKANKIAHSEFGFEGMDISPNSQWVAFVADNRMTGGSVYVHEVKSGKTTLVDEGMYPSTDVCFDLNGTYLYFTSQRTFNPTQGIYEASLKVDEASRIYCAALNPDVANPFLEKSDEEGGDKSDAKQGEPKLDLTGVQARIMVLPMPVSAYANLVGAAGGLFYWDKGTLYKYEVGSKQPTPILAGLPGPAYTFNATRTKFATMLGGRVQVFDAQPGQQITAGVVDTTGVEANLDPKAEWRQIYWDAWRYIRDTFYDPAMRGLDWQGIGKRYAEYLPFIEHREDLNYVLGLLLGELGTGHSYITSRGDLGNLGSRVAVGRLGADLELDGDYLVFKKVLRGRPDDGIYISPLGKPGMGVKEGDFLLAVDGQKVGRAVNPDSLLVGKAGRMVTLTVARTATGEGSRKVRVRTVASENTLRYADFIERNRRYVAEASGGQIGYMHIRDTAMEGSQDFVDGFYNQFDKPALLVDERWNHGGYVQPWFVDVMTRTPQAAIQPRYSPHVLESPIHEGPKAMLINQYAGSGGDFFPYMFRKNKLGPLVGKRTWGGLVGISGGYRLNDGGAITAPAFSLYDPDKGEIIAENMGTEPDIDVDLSPDKLAKGIDPQLQAAVKYLMDELKKNPPRKLGRFVPKLGEKAKIEK